MDASLCASPPRSGKPNGLLKHPLEPLVQDNDQTGADGEEPFLLTSFKLHALIATRVKASQPTTKYLPAAIYSRVFTHWQAINISIKAKLYRYTP